MMNQGRSFHDMLLPSASDYLPGGAAYLKAMNAWSTAANQQSYPIVVLTVLMVMVALGMTGMVMMVRKYQTKSQQHLGMNSYGSR